MKIHHSKFAIAFLLTVAIQSSSFAQEKTARLQELRVGDDKLPLLCLDWVEEGPFTKTDGEDYISYTYEQPRAKFGSDAIWLNIYIGYHPLPIESRVAGKQFATGYEEFKTERAIWFKWKETGKDGVVRNYSMVHLMNVFRDTSAPLPEFPPPLVCITLSGASSTEMLRFEKLLMSIHPKK